MTHTTFKVCILIDNSVENFYIKHYIDEFQPVFLRFKNQVFQRNPSVNSPHLKIYWIDAENDEILVACEEDFRLYLEEGKGKKIFFNVINKNNQQNEDVQDEAMEAEEVPRCERRSRRSAREEEKMQRQAKKLAEKLKHLEDSCRNESERSRKHCEKREYKKTERLDKAKRRVEQIRSIIGSIDPANLNASQMDSSAEASSSSTAVTPSPEIIQLLSNAIAGCLQPCSLINKVLNEIVLMLPQLNEIQMPAQQQQSSAAAQTEIPVQTAATNTSDVNSPIPVRQANYEIEALFKEAAKELEKMHEIVNTSCSNSMETSTSGNTGVTQIERTFENITDSAMSDATLIEAEPAANDSFPTVSKPHSRSRESSIEVHEVNSNMSDDSREWIMLTDQEEPSIEPVAIRNVDAKTGAVPKATTSNSEPIKSISTETQTPPLSDVSQQNQITASVQKSIEIVQKSIESIRNSMEPIGVKDQEPPKTVQEASQPVQKEPEPVQKEPEPAVTLPSVNIYPAIPQSQANIKATRKPGPAVVVYDPNPKINQAVHTMMNMGFTNEDNWLTQLLINVDGDVAKALNFLTPQPKGKTAA